MSGRPAIFLDRDGTLNASVGYVNHESRFLLYPWTVEAIRTITQEDYLAVVVTNQSGVGRGFYGRDLVEELHDGLRALVRDAGGELAGAYYCPHAPAEGCRCRKPEAGMLLDARDDLGIDLARSWIVGDTYTDLRAGWAAGTKAALVLTGFGEGTWRHEGPSWRRPPDLVGANLHEVVCSIFWGSLD